ncbi:MAG: FkbM family methyltransferase [Verrucomicrobiota bacterium]
MPSIANALHTLNEIRIHPLMRSWKFAAYKRWLKWQIGSRLVPGLVVANFVNDTRLCLRAGMHGATMNLYVGLDEYKAMSFVLHFLRLGETFVDVGANVGAFTILASGAVRARTIAFEPAPNSFNDLLLNVKVNNLENHVDCRQIALSNKKGEALFTRELDTLNHVVLSPDAESGAMIRVKASTLDEELSGGSPVMIKMDAEGYENNILDGANQTFSSPDLLALIVEINANCHRYGFTESQIFERILNYGFISVVYDPLERRLMRCGSWDSERGAEANTIFVRDINVATQRLIMAPKFKTIAYEI